jgi:hypothetical protein
MNNVLKFLCLFSILIFLACGKNKTIHVNFNHASSVLKYGVSLLEEHAQESGFSIQQNDLDEANNEITIISINDSINPKLNSFRSQNISGIKDDGFKIIRNEDQIYIIGNSDRGCLYGLIDLIEQMGADCDISKVEDKQINPANKFRAVKINLPWSPYRPGPTNDVHIETCKDLKFWKAFLDMLVKNRFNAVSLWNNHPFPYMIRAKNYPKATPFDDEELAGWQHFFKTLFKMAKERGLDTYLINWNIVVSPEFAENYGSKEYFDRSELVKKYTRESVTQVINEYEDLTGFGTTLADWMGNWGDEKMTPEEREEWIKETIVEGIKNADRKVKFIHRAVLSGDPKLMREVIDYADLPEKTNVEIKFNWSHGHSTPKLSLTHANDDGTIMNGFWDPKPENFFITWMVRNEDFFVLRWGDPEFIRDHINTNKKDYVQGYFIGSEGYIPANDYSHIEPHPHKTWKYAFEKQWMFYHLWGRLLFDPNEKETTLAEEINRRYPTIDALAFLKAYSLASKVPLNIATFYKGTWDFTLYSEGFLAPWQPDIEDGRSPFISLQELVDHETLDRSYMNIDDYVTKVHENIPIEEGMITPVELAEITKSNCDKALNIINTLEEQGDDPTYKSEIEDFKTWCYLGYYFAEKIYAGVSLKSFMQMKDKNDKKTSLQHAEKALENWKNIVKLTETRYKLMPYVMMTHPENKWPDFKGFHWKNYLKEVEYDIEYIKSIK